MEFANTGTEGKELHHQVEGSGSGGHHPSSVLAETGLARQASVFSLTFDEFQSNHGSNIGKDFGSMNIEELLKNIWSAEESQMLTATGGTGLPKATDSGLQKQSSLKLPRTISLKTVDEVWRDFFLREDNCCVGGVSVGEGGHGSADTIVNFPQSPPQQETLGKMTLEQFLERAGVIREEIPSQETSSVTLNTNNADFRATTTATPTNTTNTGLSLGFPSATTFPTTDGGGGIIGSGVIPRPTEQDMIFFPTAEAAAAAAVGGVGDPMMMSNGEGLVESDVVGYRTSPGDLGSSLSPGVPYFYDRGTSGEKKSGGCGVERAVERRQKRMIKNRESAARSRARKQAYTSELEAEVKKLKEQNQELQKKHDMLEAEKNQALEMVRHQHKKPPPPHPPRM